MVDCQKQTTLTVNIQLEPGLGIALNQSVDHPEDWPIKNCSWHILYGSTLYIMPTIKVMECFLNNINKCHIVFDMGLKVWFMDPCITYLYNLIILIYYWLQVYLLYVHLNVFFPIVIVIIY
jgi:hypothetical protein